MPRGLCGLIPRPRRLTVLGAGVLALLAAPAVAHAGFLPKGLASKVEEDANDTYAVIVQAAPGKLGCDLAAEIREIGRA